MKSGGGYNAPIGPCHAPWHNYTWKKKKTPPFENLSIAFSNSSRILFQDRQIWIQRHRKSKNIFFHCRNSNFKCFDQNFDFALGVLRRRRNFRGWHRLRSLPSRVCRHWRSLRHGMRCRWRTPRRQDHLRWRKKPQRKFSGNYLARCEEKCVLITTLKNQILKFLRNNWIKMQKPISSCQILTFWFLEIQKFKFRFP